MSRRLPLEWTMFAGIAICLSSISVGAHSAELRVACPQWLEPDTVKAQRPPKGWTAEFMPFKARLDSGGMLHGAPNESAYLKPYEIKEKKTGARASTWTMRWVFSTPHSYETWLYCGYGPLELFQRIPVGATECTKTSKRANGAFDEMVFVCK